MLAVVANSYLLFAYSQVFRDFAWNVSKFGMKLYNVILLEHIFIIAIVVIRYILPADPQVKLVEGSGSGDNAEAQVRLMQEIEQQKKRISDLEAANKRLKD